MNNTLTPEDMSFIREAVRSKAEVILHAPYRDVARGLFDLLGALRTTWAGSDHINNTKWTIHGREMCYFLEEDNTVSYSAKSYFESDGSYAGMTIRTLGLKD